MDLLLRELRYGSELYQQARALRDEILLRPFAIPLEQATADDPGARHFAACVVPLVGEGSRARALEVVATVLMVPRPLGRVQLRQMAVRTDLQRRGVGRRLLSYAEARLLGEELLDEELLDEELSEPGGIEVVDPEPVGRSLVVFAHARQSAVPFYEALGYRVAGEPFVQVGLPHALMEKPLLGGELRSA